MIFFRVCRRSDGWTITDPLPDIDSLGQSFIDYLEISEPPFSVLEAGEKPGKNLEEYKYRLSKARRRVPPENSIMSLTCPFVCAAGAVMVG